MKALWPYVLPLPIEREAFNRVFQAVFGSKAALEILKKSSPNKRIYQKEIIADLGFSNKTVIEALKKLVSAGVLEQGMERRMENGKMVWTKWYTPTFQGKWITLLLQSPKNLSRDEAREIVMELFKMYIDNITKLCDDYDIYPEIFETTINNAYLKIIERTKPELNQKSKVIVYGSAAVDTIAEGERFPTEDETIYLSDVKSYPGGSAANVSVGLKRLGIPVTFVGKVGGDAEGVLLVKEFRKEGIEASGIIIEPEKRTVRTFVMVGQNGSKRAYVLGGDDTALAISSPSEVDWKKLQENEVVYIGEAFIEVAELLASYAKNIGKKVIYRPGLTIAAFDPDGVRRILRNVDILILNSHVWKAIKNSNSTPSELIKLGPEIIVITKGASGCETYTRNENFSTSAYPIKVKDTTGAGDAFSAGLITAILEKKSLKDAIKFALAVSALTVTKRGTRTGLPTRLEVEEFMKKKME